MLSATDVCNIEQTVVSIGEALHLGRLINEEGILRYSAGAEDIGLLWIMNQ